MHIYGINSIPRLSFYSNLTLCLINFRIYFYFLGQELRKLTKRLRRSVKQSGIAFIKYHIAVISVIRV